MTRPPTPSRFDWSGMRDDERRAYNVARAAWDATPEGQVELAAEKARVLAAFEAERVASATRMFRGEKSDYYERVELPPRAAETVLAGDLQVTVARAAVRGAKDICILLGGAGVGKTVAATARVHEEFFAVENWSTYDPANYETHPRFRVAMPVWTSAAGLARLDHFSDDAVKPFMWAPLLVIDDLGGEYQDAKGFFLSLLDELVDARYSRKLATIVTSNLDLAAFTTRYGVRIVDRIREAGRFVGCGNASLRRRPAP
jgi:hypothetical protein